MIKVSCRGAMTTKYHSLFDDTNSYLNISLAGAFFFFKHFLFANSKNT